MSDARKRPSPRNYRILLAYDGSEQAQAAIELAQVLFGKCAGKSCHVTAMTVLPVQYFHAHEQLLRSLDNVKDRLDHAGLQAETILKTGSPAASLIAYAEEHSTDLIVMGALGLRSTLGILLGGVAQQVVEHAHLPVLVVRPPYRGLRRVLVVSDGSAFSRRAIEYLAPICVETPPDQLRIHGLPQTEIDKEPVRGRCSWLPENTAVTVVHVMPPIISADMAAHAWTLGPEVLYPAPVTPIDIEYFEKQEEQTGAEILNEARRVFNASGLVVRTLLRRGDAATEILQLAREEGADMIVCGSRRVESDQRLAAGQRFAQTGPLCALLSADCQITIIG